MGQKKEEISEPVTLLDKFDEIEFICYQNKISFSLNYNNAEGYYFRLGFGGSGKYFAGSNIEDAAEYVLLYLHENYDKNKED